MVRLIALLALVAGVTGEDRVDECKFRARRVFFFPSPLPPLFFFFYTVASSRNPLTLFSGLMGLQLTYDG